MHQVVEELRPDSRTERNAHQNTHKLTAAVSYDEFILCQCKWNMYFEICWLSSIVDGGGQPPFNLNAICKLCIFARAFCCWCFCWGRKLYNQTRWQEDEAEYKVSLFFGCGQPEAFPTILLGTKIDCGYKISVHYCVLFKCTYQSDGGWTRENPHIICALHTCMRKHAS